MCVSNHIRGAGSESDGETYRLRINEPEANESTPYIRSGEVSHVRRYDSAKDVSYNDSEKTGCIAC
jgi:hypothetical protein